MGIVAGKGPGVARYVGGLQSQGIRVLYVTADLPASILVPQLVSKGVDVGLLVVVDAISGIKGNLARAPAPPVLFVASPTMLEMIAMRVGKVTSDHKRWHVVVDSLDALALYNGAGPVQEFAHHLANVLREARVDGTLLVRGEAGDLRVRVSQFMDGSVEVS